MVKCQVRVPGKGVHHYRSVRCGICKPECTRNIKVGYSVDRKKCLFGGNQTAMAISSGGRQRIAKGRENIASFKETGDGREPVSWNSP